MELQERERFRHMSAAERSLVRAARGGRPVAMRERRPAGGTLSRREEQLLKRNIKLAERVKELRAERDLHRKRADDMEHGMERSEKAHGYTVGAHAAEIRRLWDIIHANKLDDLFPLWPG